MNPTRFKKIFPIVILCCLTTWTWAQEKVVMTLDKAVEYALENSLDVRLAQLRVEDAEQQIIEARATGLPQINADASYNYFFRVPTQVLPEQFLQLFDAIALLNGGGMPTEPMEVSNQASFVLRNQFQAGINFRTMVFDGSFFTGLKAAGLYRNLLQDELAALKQGLESNVIEAYLPAIIVNENLKILDKNIGNVEALLQETEALYKEGFVEQLDVDRLVLTTANLKTERKNLARQYETTVNGLKAAINFPIEDEIVIADIEEWQNVIIPITNEDLSGKINYYNRLNYKAAETGIQLNDLNTSFTRNQYLPRVSLNASYNQAFQGNRLFNDPNSFWAPTGIVGLSLNIPIWDGMGKSAKIQKAKIATEISKTQQIQLAKQIDVEVANARISYTSAIETLEGQKSNLALAERIYETTKIKYKEGVGSSLEITQAEQGLFDSQRNYTTALFEVLVAKLALYRALGKLNIE